MKHPVVIALVAYFALVLMGCAGTQAERQENADQIFGTAKVVYVVASLAVSVYNQLAPCEQGGAQPPLCYSENVGVILDRGMVAAALAIKGAEETFAAANTDEDARVKAANIAKAMVENLMAAVRQFGLTKLASN